MIILFIILFAAALIIWGLVDYKLSDKKDREILDKYLANKRKSDIESKPRILKVNGRARSSPAAYFPRIFYASPSSNILTVNPRSARVKGI